MPKAEHEDHEEESDNEEQDQSGTEDDEAGDDNSYEPPEVLSEMHWHRRQVADIVDMMATPYLDLNPDYQRDVVWTSERMTKLINSMMGRFYVPPLIFNVTKKFVDGSEKYLRRSIDGKQRLTSIREFVNGNIPCTDGKMRRWYFKENAKPETAVKSKRRILPQRARRKFLATELLCVEYSNLVLYQEEDLFSRVQLGMPLTPAEKLRASSGTWQRYAIELEKEYQTLISGVVENKRGRGFQLILQVLKQILKGEDDDSDPKYSAGAGALKGFCDHPEMLDEKFKAVVSAVFKKYTEVLEKYPDTFENQEYTHATKFSPVEFVGVAVLIHRFPNRNPRLLSLDILAMRNFMRNERQDLRSNTSTWKIIIDFILHIEKHRGAIEPLNRNRGPNRKFGSASDGETIIGDLEGNIFGDKPTSAKKAATIKAAKAKAAAANITPAISKAPGVITSKATNTRSASKRHVPFDEDDSESQIRRESILSSQQRPNPHATATPTPMVRQNPPASTPSLQQTIVSNNHTTSSTGTPPLFKDLSFSRDWSEDIPTPVSTQSRTPAPPTRTAAPAPTPAFPHSATRTPAPPTRTYAQQPPLQSLPVLLSLAEVQGRPYNRDHERDHRERSPPRAYGDNRRSHVEHTQVGGFTVRAPNAPRNSGYANHYNDNNNYSQRSQYAEHSGGRGGGDFSSRFQAVRQTQEHRAWKDGGAVRKRDREGEERVGNVKRERIGPFDMSDA